MNVADHGGSSEEGEVVRRKAAVDGTVRKGLCGGDI